MTASSHREHQPLSQALLDALPSAGLSEEQRGTITELSRTIGGIPIDYIALISRKPRHQKDTPSFRFNVYSRDKLDFGDSEQSKYRRGLADAHEAAALALDSVGTDFNLGLTQTQGRSPEQIRAGLMRTYDSPFSGWEVVLSGWLQFIPGQEPDIIPDATDQPADILSKTSSKTC